MLQISLVQFLCKGTAKTKLAVLAFFYCGQFVKKPIFVIIFFFTARMDGPHKFLSFFQTMKKKTFVYVVASRV